MRLSNVVLLIAVAAGLLSSGNALSTADNAKVSKMASTDSVQKNDETKRSLRAVQDDDEEERGNWTRVAEKIAADVKANEDKFVNYIKQSYKSGDVNGRVAYAAAIKLGYSKEQATKMLMKAGVFKSTH